MKIDDSIAAVVTGGASGLGRASAEALAAAGVKVAVFDVNEAGGEEVAKAIGGVFCKVDITSEESVEAGYEKARAANGQERIVVHCAVVTGGGKTLSFDKASGSYRRNPTEMIARSAEGIFTASYRISSHAALGMANASSAASQDGQIGQVAYGGGKGAVNSMVLPMARDLMDVGIRVNAILPGIFATPPMLGVKDKAPAIFAGLEASVPFPKRLGNPAEFGSLVMELARNTYFNGQCIRLDGAIRMPPK